MFPRAGSDTEFMPKMPDHCLDYETGSQVLFKGLREVSSERSIASPKGLIFSSANLHRISLERFRTHILTKTSPEGLSVFSG